MFAAQRDLTFDVCLDELVREKRWWTVQFLPNLICPCPVAFLSEKKHRFLQGKRGDYTSHEGHGSALDINGIKIRAEGLGGCDTVHPLTTLPVPRVRRSRPGQVKL